jgi:ankyrin repeat protein
MTRLATMLLAALSLLAPPALGQSTPRNPHFPTAPLEALFEAAQKGSLEGIRAAIEAGADVNWREDSGASALSYAASNATDPAVIAYLVDEAGADLLARHHYWTPLHCAASSNKNNAAVVKALVERYAPPRAPATMAELPLCFEGRNPIMLAAEAGRSTEILDALMTYATTSDLQVRDSEGRNALTRCAMTPGRADQIRWLLDHGADPDVQNDSLRMSRGEGYNRTALMKAAYGRCRENLRAMLIVNAPGRIRYRQFDPDITDDFGKTALDYARENELLDGTEELERLEFAFQLNRFWKAAASGNLQQLSETTTSPDLFRTRRADGAHALIIAARTNPHPQVLNLLLQIHENAGPERDSTQAGLATTDDHGKTALDYAEQNEALQGTDALQRLREATQSRSAN